MRGEIRNIRFVAKDGAFGNKLAIGLYIYGKRRDGRTVACKNELQADGGIQIWSDYAAPGEGWDWLEDMTEFTREEWARIQSAKDYDAVSICNEILDTRR